MARTFNGSTDRIDYAATIDWRTAQTVSLWATLVDATPAATKYFACLHTGSTVIAIFNYIASGALALTWVGNTTFNRVTGTGFVQTGLAHYLYTWDGSNTETNCHIYKNGIEAAPYGTGSNGAALTNADGTFSLGGRLPDDLRNHEGMIAEYGQWNRVLTAAEITALALGASPLNIPGSLKRYMPLVNDPNDRLNGVGTLDGTTVSAHPRIIYTHRRWNRSLVVAAGGFFASSAYQNGRVIGSGVF